MDNKSKSTDKSKESNSKSTKPETDAIKDFPVVGVGASAGGLEALQMFFHGMPEKTGVAFVIVQHLSPDYKSFMSELLSRDTEIPIHVVTDGIEIREDNIYLIPPKNNMTIESGKLHLKEIDQSRGLNLPIDIFLRSLAKDKEKNAIGIILSGTGSDGTLGIRAIKEFGGMTMAQDDRSAKFDGMPRSSIATGMVDYILPPKKLAQALVDYVKHPFVKQSNNIESQLTLESSLLSKALRIIHEHKGVDFSDYKDNTVIRRIEKRISINRFDNVEQYIDYLDSNLKEVDVLFNELLIGVTRFYRDEPVFSVLKPKVIAPIIERTPPRQEIRVWVTACSTGEEAYSIAMLFREVMSETKKFHDVKIFATDLDQNSLEFAGIGIYPDNIVSDLPKGYLTRYFTRLESGYKINDSIRSMIIFATHNILADPPFSKLDLISCRNLLIYFNPDVQQQVLSTFHMCLNQNSYLFLGKSESLGEVEQGFRAVDHKAKIFQKLSKKFNADSLSGRYSTSGNAGNLRTRSEMLKSNYHVGTSRQKNRFLLRIFDQIMLDHLPPSVIIDEEYDIIHTIRSVNDYLSIPVGSVNFNLMNMLSKELSVIVSSLIRRAREQDTEIIIDKITSEKEGHDLTISCKRLSDKQNETDYFLISFAEKEKSQKSERIGKIEKIDINKQYQERIEELENELQLKSESLQATVEELETSNEELQSSNEELITSNEELQSTNEELSSVNEELNTVNSEHIRKIEELTELNADFDNLLSNTSVGNLYLDDMERIRKVNSVAGELTNILPSDIGRPINHLSLGSLDDTLLDDIRQVNETLEPIEREVKGQNNKWFLMRILPYRTIENAVSGTIITFIDITSLKKAETQTDRLSQRLENSLKMGEMSWWEWDVKNNIVSVGDGKYEMLGYRRDEIEGSGFEAWTALIHPDDYDKAMQAMHDHLQGKAKTYYVEYRIRHKDGSYIWYRDKGGIVERDEDGKPTMLMGVVMNVTDDLERIKRHKLELMMVEDDLRANEEKYKVLYHSMIQGVVFQARNGRIIDVNPAAEKILGVSFAEMTGRTSESPQWKPKYPDGREFPGEKHPAMLALQTGKVYKDVLMDVYNPKKKKYIRINITAVPVIDKVTDIVDSVYAIFDEVPLESANNSEENENGQKGR